MSIGLAASLEIIECTSDTTNFNCDSDEICSCTISGDCINGNLMVYKEIGNPLCFPPISGSHADIDWDDCDNPEDSVKVRAVCDEGQSLEKTVLISLAGTTTSTTTTAETTTRITTTIETTTKEDCPDDWECCVGEEDYEDFYCSGGWECCDGHVCRESCGGEGGGKTIVLIIIGVLIIVLVGATVYFMKSKGGPKPNLKWTLK